MKSVFSTKRQRYCRNCGKRWNTSCVGANPKRYICPQCEAKHAEKQKKAASSVGAPDTAGRKFHNISTDIVTLMEV